ncbi:MAG: DNA polymerase III subunit delta [Nitrospira sp.]
MGLLVKSLELESKTQIHSPAPVYAVIGEEDYLRDHAVAALKRAVLGEGQDDGFNCDVFHGDEDAADEVLSCAMEIPVFASRRFVVLKQADKWPARETEKCLPYLNAPHESTTLIFAAAKLDRRLKWTQTLMQKAVVVDCDPLQDRQIPAWIGQEAASLGITVREDAVQALKESAGSLYALRRELEKLAAYVPAGRAVTVEDVQALRGTEPGASVFDLTMAIGAGARGRALTILARNLEAGEAPLRILGALVWQYRRLWKVKDSVQRGGRTAEAGRALRMDPAKAATLLSQFPDGHMNQAFRLFMEVDSKLKGGSSGAAKRVLEDLLLQLCRKPKAPDKPQPGSTGGAPRKPSGERTVSNVRTIRSVKR